MSKRNEMTELLKKLISIDSSNAFLTPGSPGEYEVLRYIQNYMDESGVSACQEDTGDGHKNLIATLAGSGGGRPITLYAHADTVGYAAWKDTALKAEVKGDELIGLGACDDKGHCAAMMLACRELAAQKNRLRGDVHFAFVADEEGESCGSFAYVKAHAPEAALILESSPLHEINICHQGFGWLDIIVKGKAGHGSATASADAIARMGEVIVRLSRNQREMFAKTPHPLNGETVYHTGTVNGGSDYATYPDLCKLGIEIGTQPGESIGDRIREIEEIFDEVREIYPDLEARAETVIARSPFETKGTEELFRIVSEEIEEALGVKTKAVGANSWGDAQIFQDAGFPTLGMGALGGNLHSPGEWVSLVQLEQLTNVLISIIKRYCG